MRYIALAVLLCCFLQLAAAQKLTGNMTSGITCTTGVGEGAGGGRGVYCSSEGLCGLMALPAEAAAVAPLSDLLEWHLTPWDANGCPGRRVAPSTRAVTLCTAHCTTQECTHIPLNPTHPCCRTLTRRRHQPIWQRLPQG